MDIGSFLGLLLFASVSWLAASTTTPLQSETNPAAPVPFRLTLNIEHETYSRIPGSMDHTKEPHVLLTLQLRLRFANQTEEVVKVDTKCILLSLKVIYDNPLVGPPEELTSGRERIFALRGCPYAADEKLLRLHPGESFEATQQVKFGVVTQGRFHPPDTLKPGEYFLKLTELTWWEIDGQDQNLKEKWKKPGALIGRAVNSELMGFVVEGKPIKRRA
jgi:hypothetical protein